ncbi:translesion DNA synthesis-associated protein ImuA [Collimonas sp.]|jgi:protein ImuA|uniref:translesion DNA synthesis-associated protein ImuA n=1 Tax=Collimonas sp. TaxID=1963772 RepID=UPI002BF766F9|nr:translesion DNA synthesis-associated protein ImuA [Collimonas sp.]HWX03781.1 translesion DNA synthesis-associated protein ImuA [Collimonas sp.]
MSLSASASSSLAAAVQSVVSTLPHALWRADQMGSYQGAVTASGHAALDRELPNGGWPHSALIELLLHQSGCGEMRLLQPALLQIAQQRRIVLLQPPHLPQLAAWENVGLASEKLLWIKTARSVDALWSAEQVLRNGSCGALLMWQPHIRGEALRRLHLAAQASDTLLWMIRPLSAAHESSPSPLRLSLQPARNGVEIQLLKRKGPQHEHAFYLPLPASVAETAAAAATLTTPSATPHHGTLDRHTSPAIGAGNLAPALV